MASITIRNLDDRLKCRLHIQTAVRCRPMEDEARDILQRTRKDSLAASIHARAPMRAPPSFDE